MKLELSPTKITGLSLLSIAALATTLASTNSCAPADKSVGPDSVATGGGTQGPTGHAGAPVTTGSAGAPAVPSAGAPSTSAGAGNDASGGAGNATSGGAPATGGGAPGASAGSGANTGGAPPAGGGAPAVGGGAPSGPGGDSKCAALTGATLCDGFETAAPGAAGSDWTIKGATITLDTTKFYRGKSSVKYSSMDSSYIVEKKTFAGTTKATNNAFWARYFVLSGVSTYPAGHTVFGTLADTADATDPNRFHFVGGSRQKLMAEIRITGDTYTNAGGGQAPNAMAPPFPVVADGWKCWEFQVTADDSFAFYIDGVEVTDMRITKGKANGGTFSPLPIFGQMQLGWQSFGGAPVVSGWIDEVAIGPTRIGCNN